MELKKGQFLVGYQEAKGELGKRTIELAKSVGIEYLWNYTRAGCLHTEAMSRGVPSIVIDYIGEDSRVSEKDVSLGIKCINNIMMHLEMLEGTPCLSSKWTLMLGRTLKDNQLFSKCGGFFQRTVEAGQKVNKGDVLGIICDVFGKEMERIYTPHDDALVMAIRTYPSVSPGDWCAFAPRIVGTVEG